MFHYICLKEHPEKELIVIAMIRLPLVNFVCGNCDFQQTLL